MNLVLFVDVPSNYSDNDVCNIFLDVVIGPVVFNSVQLGGGGEGYNLYQKENVIVKVRQKVRGRVGHIITLSLPIH